MIKQIIIFEIFLFTVSFFPLYAESSSDKDVIEKAYLTANLGDYNGALEAFTEILNLNKDNLDAQVGEIYVWSKMGLDNFANNLSSKIWTRCNKYQKIIMIKSFIIMYINSYQVEKANIWFQNLKEIDDNKDDVNKIKDQLSELESNMLNSNIDYNILRTKSDVSMNTLKYLILKIIPKDSSYLLPIAENTITAQLECLQVIDEWKYSDPYIVVSGFKSHDATERILIVYDIKKEVGVVCYWEMYEDMYIFNNTNNIIDSNINLQINEWISNLSDQYKSKYFPSTLKMVFKFSSNYIR